MIRWPRREQAGQAVGETAHEAPAVDVQHSPGLDAALGLVRSAGGERVLDLGPCVAANFEFFGSLARHLRVADLLAGDLEGSSSEGAGGPPLIDPEWGPFDLVLARDVLTYLEPEDAAKVVAALAGVCLPGACLFALVTTTEEAAGREIVFVVHDPAELEYRAADRARERRMRKATPAAIQRLLAPFRVERSYVLRNGFREYVAVLE